MRIFIILTIIYTTLTLSSENALAFTDATYVMGPIQPVSTVRFNNANWDALTHPKVAEFTVRGDGSAYGLTESGIYFVQYNIPNTLGIRVQRFEIEDHYHYIVDGVVVNDFTEFSSVLARAYNTQVGAG